MNRVNVGTAERAAAHDRAPRLSRVRSLERWPLWVRWLVTAAFFVLLATSLVARYIPVQHTLSRADEYVYIDAVDKATHWNVTQRGELIDQYALSLISCIGVDGYPQGSPCGGPYVRALVPWDGGHTSADIHPPTYFFITAGMASVIRATTPAQDLLTAARLTSGIWLGLGLTVLVALTRALGCSRTASAATALLVLSLPAMRWTNSFVTPDALSLFVGATVALTAVMMLARRWSPWWLVLACAFAGAVKAQDVLAAGFVFLFLVMTVAMRWWSDRSQRDWRPVAWGSAAVVAAMIPQALWEYARSATALGPAPSQGLATPKLTLLSVLRDSTVFMRGLVNGPDATYPPAWAGGNPISTHGEIASWLLVAGVVALSLFADNPGSRQRIFGRAALLSLVLGAPLLRVSIYLATHGNFGVPERYGDVLLPMMAGSLAVMMRRRWVAVLIGLLALGFLAVEFTFVDRW